MRRRAGIVCLAGFAVLLATNQPAQPTSTAGQSAPAERAVIDRDCITCHNDRFETGGLSLETVDIGEIGATLRRLNRPRGFGA